MLLELVELILDDGNESALHLAQNFLLRFCLANALPQANEKPLHIILRDILRIVGYSFRIERGKDSPIHVADLL